MNSIVENIPTEYCLDKKVKEEFKDQDCLFNFFKNFSGDDKVIAFVLTDHFALNGVIFLRRIQSSDIDCTTASFAGGCKLCRKIE